MNRSLVLIMVSLVSLAFLAGGAWAVQICVDPGGGGDYTDLQAALTYAQGNGEDDTIKVVEGTYTDNFEYRSTQGHSITLQGGYTSGCAGRVVDPTKTVLDGGGTGQVLYLENDNGGNVQLDGFTIQNGTTNSYGGGVYADSRNASTTGYINSGDVTITNNIITANSAHYGGGIYTYSASYSGAAGTVTVSNNVVSGNPCTYDGCGVYAQLYSTSATAGALILVNNVVTGNIPSSSDSSHGGGVFASSYSPVTPPPVTITNNTITGNSAVFGGGAYLQISSSSGGTINVYNNIIRGNTASPIGDGDDVYLIKTTGNVAYSNNNDVSDVAGDLWDDDGGGDHNINEDPLFIDSAHGDYHLQATSPCIDAGTNAAPSLPATDFDGEPRIIDGNNDGTATVDMGADEYAAVLYTCVSNAKELQDALTAAQANGAYDFIQVVQGTYTGNFTYKSSEGLSIHLLGGYTAGCASRVVNPENTVLDGSHAGGVLSLVNNSGGDIQLDGFTMQHGDAEGAEGGGVWAYSYSGSGTAGTITLTNNIITANSSQGGGGGVFAWSYSHSGTAGALFLTNNTIQGNNAGGNGGGVLAWSGTYSGAAGAITLTNNTIKGNIIFDSLGYIGGGVYARSYSDDSGTAGTVTLTNNTISGNISGAAGGGGVAAISMSPSGDMAGDVILLNNIVTGNSAPGDGGGVYAQSTSSGMAGTVTITNNTITGNNAPGGDGGGGVYFYVSGSSGSTVNCYNNIIWGNTCTAGGDIYLGGSGTFNGYNNDYTNMSGSWTDSGGNINLDPLFADSAHGDYHLRPASPCIDTGNNTPPDGFPSTDFEGDARVIDGNNDGTAIVDMGADEFNVFPPDGTIFAGCSLINKYQPVFRWIGLVGPFKSYTIFFSTSDTDFSTKGVLITKANIKGTKSSYLPSSGVWKKLFTASWNGGTIRNIYWEVIGKRADKSTVPSAVWSFSVDAVYPPEILLPPGPYPVELHAALPPTFQFDTMCNIKFRLEISPLVGFTDPKKIKAFTYSVKDPNAMSVFTKTLSASQWKAVQKLIGTGTGYFRIKGWDVIKREADSPTQSFTITP